MLVTIALFSFILGTFGVAFNRLYQASNTIVHLEGSENIDVVRRFLLNIFEEIRPYAPIGQKGMKLLLFEGAPSSIRFAGVSSVYGEIGGLYDTEIRLNAQGQLQLIRRPLGWGSNLLVNPEILLKNVANVSFSYAPCPSNRRTVQTHHWSDRTHLPYLVSMEVSFEHTGRRRWQPMVAFIASASCPVRQ